MMQKMANNAHPMTEERRARLEEAAKHPDAEDCRKAREAFADFARALGSKPEAELALNNA